MKTVWSSARSKSEDSDFRHTPARQSHKHAQTDAHQHHDVSRKQSILECFLGGLDVKDGLELPSGRSSLNHQGAPPCGGGGRATAGSLSHCFRASGPNPLVSSPAPSHASSFSGLLEKLCSRLLWKSSSGSSGTRNSRRRSYRQ